MHDPSPVDSPLLLTTEEAARALRVSPRTLFTLTKRGEVPAVRIGVKSVRYNPAALRDFVEQQQTTASPVPRAMQ